MSTQCGVPNPYGKIDRQLKVQKRIQVGPGPANSTKDVIDAMNIQPVSFLHEQFYQILDETKEMAKYIFQTNNEFTVVQQTSGNGGNEAMVTNLADPGDTIIVAIQGSWGKLVADMGRRYNLNVVELKAEPGECFDFSYLEEEIIKNNAVTLFVTHGESSGGTLQQLAGLGEICHRHNCLLAVDAVASLGVVPILVDEWQLDAVNGASQKGLGAPIGMTLLTFSQRALDRMKSKQSKPPYIYDMLILGDVWNCFGKPRQYIYSYGIHLICAIRKCLLDICEEGLENVWERHRRASELFLDKVSKLGITHFVEKPENRFLGVNLVRLPEDVDSLDLTAYVLDKYQMEWGIGLGPSGGQNVLRVGFFADCARTETVEKLVEALEEGMEYTREHPQANKDSSLLKCLKKWR